MADIKVAYGTAVSMAVTNLPSLASDLNLLSGWQSAIEDNTTTLAADILLSGKVTVGVTPSVDRVIYVYAWAQLDPTTPVRPENFGTTASVRSIVSDGTAANFLRPIAAMNVDSSTTNRIYWFGPVSLAQTFGGVLPAKWGLWVVHNTTAALDSISGSFAFWYTPTYYTVA
jgi:hypothetical protein